MNCKTCGETIGELRLKVLPNTKYCVKCSPIQKKGGITVQLGEGDHTYNEIIIMEADELNDMNIQIPLDIELIEDENKELSIRDINSFLLYDSDNINIEETETETEETETEEEDDIKE